MNFKLVRYSTIAVFVLVVILGGGCTPANIAPLIRAVSDETSRSNSGSNTPSMPVAQTPYDLPGKSGNKDRTEDKGKSDDRGRSEDRGKSENKGKSEDRGKSDHRGKSHDKGKA